MISFVATAIAGAAITAGGVLLRRRQLDEVQLEHLKQARAVRLTSLATDRDTALADAQAAAERRRARLAQQLERAQVRAEATAQRLQLREGSVQLRQQARQEESEQIEDRYTQLKAQLQVIKTHRQEITDLDRQLHALVEKRSLTTRDRIIEDLGEALGSEARIAAQKAATLLEEHTQAMQDSLAQHAIEAACQRFGAPLSAERLQGTVNLPSDARRLEALTGAGRATLLALEAATQSEFVAQEGDILRIKAENPYQREVARLAYERLLSAAQLDEQQAVKAAVSAERGLDKIVRQAGQEAAKMLRIEKMHPEILRLVGMLLYRTSYTQNQWTHAIETAQLCAYMAQELGVDVAKARRSALIHDIGKVLFEETARVGSHAVTGAKFAAEHGESPEIVHPVAAHHNDEPPSTALAHLVAAADALSGARPGARRETEEAYGSRLEDFDRICSEYPEIELSYVIQGGREVRIFADPDRLDDLGALELSEEIAERIESEVDYPGKVKVTVLREVRSVAVARSHRSA